jgi:hypothetical protein
VSASQPDARHGALATGQCGATLTWARPGVMTAPPFAEGATRVHSGITPGRRSVDLIDERYRHTISSRVSVLPLSCQAALPQGKPRPM